MKTLIRKIAFVTLLTLINTLSYAKPLTLLLDWFVNPDQAPIFVAKNQGFFKEQGLEVTIIPPSDPADPLKLVAAQQADIGLTYEPDLTVAASHGLPVVRVGTLINHPLACLAVLKNGPVHSLKDLKGKKVGHSGGNNNSAMLNTFLRHAHLTQKDIQLINMHYGETQALLSGRIDAMTGAMRNFELIELELAGKPAKAFYPEKHGMPTYDELVFIVNKRSVKNPQIYRFMLAVQQGITYLQAHPEESWAIFAKNYPALNTVLNKRAWFATLPYFDTHPFLLDEHRYNDYAVFLKQQGLIKAVPKVKTYAVNLKKGK